MASRVAARRIRWGILCLPLSGLLYLLTLLIAGSYIDPTTDLQGFAEQATSGRTHLVMLMDVVQTGTLLVGAFALYAYLATGRAERWALGGLVLFVVYLTAGATVRGSTVAAIPAAGRYLEGHQNALGAFVLAEDPASFPLLLAIGFAVYGLLFGLLGNLFFGIAIWRSGTLPQGAAILWIGAAILGLVALSPWYDLGGWIEALLVTLDLGGSGWIAWSVWRRPPDRG